MNLKIHVGFAIFIAISANAHHATVTNFTRELVTVDGVIEQIRYQNPHSSILIKHMSGEDETTYWLIETGAKTTLHRQGVKIVCFDVKLLACNGHLQAVKCSAGIGPFPHAGITRRPDIK